MKENRVLWLLNHETLRQCEVPLLRRLGFEVFLPKIFPQIEEFASESVDFSYDSDLTIPVAALKLLNNHDFYSQKMSPEIIEVINTYFDSAFFRYFNSFQFEQLIYHFKGNLFFRGFGRFQEECSYTELLTLTFYKQILSIQKRFFFAAAYPFLSEIEKGIYRKRALTLPFGLLPSVLEKENTWKGGNGHLLFVCPRMAANFYYQNIYAQFKKNFSEFPHLIAGKQFTAHSDPAIKGNLPREKYDALLQSSEVMFYHSEERTHLHYHPLEAIVIGLPLIFMNRGVLGRLAGSLPGGCDTVEEAKEKIRRVLQKDQMFIEEIVTAQKVLLNSFLPEEVEKIWEKHFAPIVHKSYTPRDSKVGFGGAGILDFETCLHRPCAYYIRLLSAGSNSGRRLCQIPTFESLGVYLKTRLRKESRILFYLKSEYKNIYAKIMYPFSYLRFSVFAAFRELPRLMIRIRCFLAMRTRLRKLMKRILYYLRFRVLVGIMKVPMVIVKIRCILAIRTRLRKLLNIPRVIQKLESGKAGVQNLNLPKAALCSKHRGDAGRSQSLECQHSQNQLSNHEGYKQ